MASPQVSSAKSVLVAMFAVAVGFVVAFALGSVVVAMFPKIPDTVMGTTLVGLWLVVTFGIAVWAIPWARRPSPGRAPVSAAVPAAPLPPQMNREDSAALKKRREEIRRDAERLNDTLREARRLRIAELAADPTKSKYIPLVERGEWWTDEQIAYHENSRATATCAHLQPIERAMRQSGIVPRLLTEHWKMGFTPLPKVQADCRLNEAELRRQFPLPASVQHQMGYQPERYEFDNPWARLICGDCGSAIELVHPEWPRPNTVWFPSGEGTI